MGLLSGGILGTIFGGVKDVVGEIVVDKDKRNELQAGLDRLELELADKVEVRIHEEVMGQLAINKEEAGHASIFVAGWRPAVGWVSAAGLAYGIILEPLFSWTARVWFGYAGNFPEIDPTLLVFSLGGMLGIGTMRTVEKIKGVSSDTVADLPAASRNVPAKLMIDQGPPEDAPWAT